MSAADELVARVVAGAGIPGRGARRALERELRAHLDDLADSLRATGCDDTELPERVRERFGDPAEIARAFAAVYRRRRIAYYTCLRALQLAGSFLAAGLVVSSVQLLSARARGLAWSWAFPHLPLELLGFLSLAAGYVGAGLIVRHARSPLQRNALAVLLVSLVTASLALGAGHRALAPCTACTCGVAVRMLEAARVRLALIIGSVAPLLVAWLAIGPVVAAGRVPGPLAPFLVAANLALACRALRWLAARIDSAARHLTGDDSI